MNNPRITVTAVALLAMAGIYLQQTRPSAAPTTELLGLAAPEYEPPAPPLAYPRHPAERERTLSGIARQLADVRLAADFRGALQTLHARSLDTDPLRVTAHEEVRSACALVHQPDAASPRVDLDPNRQPWLDQLQHRCAGLAADSLRPMAPNLPAARAWSNRVPEAIASAQGRDAANRQAEQLLRSAVDARLLYAALRYRLIEDQLPLAEIFPGSRIPVVADIELSLLNTADWIACARTNSCGSDGLWTLYTCAQFGCPAGIDLPTALRRLSPQWQFEISQSLTRWVLALGTA